MKHYDKTARLEARKKQLAENTIRKIRDPATNKITSSLDGIQKAFEK